MAVARALQRGRDLGAVHGLRGLRHRLPAPGPRLRDRQRRLQALPPRHRRRTRRLHPRPEGLHDVHPGLSALSQLGERDRHPALRARAHRRRGLRRRRRPARARDRRVARRERPGRRLRLGAAHLRARERRRRRGARERPRGRRLDLARRADGRAHPRGRRSTTAKSRYTYSANLLAYDEAVEGGAERIALVGMGCMASAPGAMQARKAGKVARRLCLTIGLLCSKTFDDSIFEELFEARYQHQARRHRRR